MDRLNKIRGYFSYTLEEDGKIIDSYQEENKIMDVVMHDYFKIVSGKPAGMTVDDFKLVGFAIGNNAPMAPSVSGLPPQPKPIIGTEKKLVAESNASGANYVYQVSWDKLNFTQPKGGMIVKTHEGDKNNYNGPVAPTGSETGVDVRSIIDSKNGKIELHFEMQK